ncbi:hypothetical protein RJ639_029212 [Escallonia herrerae]|uniref:Protein kinase domain-containing protein n=1 Tax=Escallonia herrerae TaxID=1293975 RepID=A0AA88XCL4_9ASTE|nr:hypothetical protein RJ639_029212 [Escallonia herrerae]
MSFPNPLEFSQADLAEFTNNFHGGNLIGPTQFGKLYRGKINARDVTVKIWDGGRCGEQEEMLLLRDSNVNHHPSLPKLIGYCIQDQMKGLLYDLNPRGSLHNLSTEANPYIVLCIDAEHILLDQESNPVVVEFGLMRGGTLGQLSPFKELIPMSPGYCDIYYARTDSDSRVAHRSAVGISLLGWTAQGVGWVAHCDVFSYGIIILGLISKRVVDKEKLGKD